MKYVVRVRTLDGLSYKLQGLSYTRNGEHEMYDLQSKFRGESLILSECGWYIDTKHIVAVKIDHEQDEV